MQHFRSLHCTAHSNSTPSCRVLHRLLPAQKTVLNPVCLACLQVSLHQHRMPRCHLQAAPLLPQVSTVPHSVASSEVHPV